MTGDMLLVFGLLAVTIILFLSDRVRLDMVALGLMLALMLSGLLTPRETLAGFGNTVVVLIAGLFVVGEALSRTGIAAAIGAWLARSAGTSTVGLQVRLMLVVAVLSAFMSSTGAVAIFVPVAYGLSRQTKIPPGLLMMPMAFAALIGGMLTLIGTPPNLIVNQELIDQGFEPFQFQSFTPIGLIILAAGTLYLITIGTKMLKRNGAGKQAGPEMQPAQTTIQDLAGNYGLSDRAALLEVLPGSRLIGPTLAELMLKPSLGMTVLAVQRDHRMGAVSAHVAGPDTIFRVGDLVLALVDHNLRKELSEAGLRMLQDRMSRSSNLDHAMGVAEVVVAPRSHLRGKSLAECEFRQRFGLMVLGIQRRGKSLGEAEDAPASNPAAEDTADSAFGPGADLADCELAMGDTLLVGGPWEQIEAVQRRSRDLLVLDIPAEWRDVAPTYTRAPWALAILLGMLGLMVFEVVPAVTAVLLAGVALVAAGCLEMKHAYQAINWQSLVLIAGMLPMATALDKTGGLAFIVDKIVANLGQLGPLALMGVLFLITAVFSQFISNTATTVLLAPIGIAIAGELGVAPQPMVMAIALAASAAFVTPVASPVNTLVLGPGGYAFKDFVRVGLPLVLLTLIMTLVFVPMLFPF